MKPSLEVLRNFRTNNYRINNYKVVMDLIIELIIIWPIFVETIIRG